MKKLERRTPLLSCTEGECEGKKLTPAASLLCARPVLVFHLYPVTYCAQEPGGGGTSVVSVLQNRKRVQGRPPGSLLSLVPIAFLSPYLV